MSDSEEKAKNVVFLAIGDELLVSELQQDIRESGYDLRQFTRLTDLERTLEDEFPLAIIVDMVFNIDTNSEAGEPAGLALIRRIKNKVKNNSSIFFITGSDSTKFRLEAAQAGADRYFYKPLVLKKFIHSLNSLKQLQEPTPYRVLLIDDEDSLLQLYSTLLTRAGIQVVTTKNPLEIANLLSEFKPDIVVLDFHMPECTGADLVKFIRQDDNWALTPVIFLSADSSLNSQLQAIEFGGDDFLEKTMPNQKIVAMLIAWAVRARKNVQLNQDLKRALRENKFQLVTMDQHAIVSSTDTSGRILSANEKFCEISGYARGELLGQNHRLIKSEHHPDEFFKDMWDTISTGKIWHGIICNRAKSGREYWVNSTIVPFLDEKGNPYKYVSARTDITALRLSEQRFTQAVEGVGDAVWDLNIETGELKVSAQGFTMLGYTENEFEATICEWKKLIHPDDLDISKIKLNYYLNGQIPDLLIEQRLRCKNGSYIWVLSRGSEVSRNEDGHVTRIVGINSNIDARKKAEEELIIARREAESANNAKSQFLSSMSHELRTPMNAIIGFSQLMQMDAVNPLNEVQASSLFEIMKAGDHLLTLINQLLDLARIETGKIELSIASVKISQVINEALQLVMPMALKYGLEVKLTRNRKDISFSSLSEYDVQVRADFTRLKQAVINLLSNAVKYNSEKGLITIACDEIDSEFIRVSISDTGQGMSPSQQENLFKAFNRLGIEKEKIEGTGIGLVISKNIIEQMNGRIGVESTPGKGSTFWIDIPRDQQIIMQPRQTAARNKASASSKGAEPVKRRKNSTILYIEDNPANLRLVSELLGRLPHIQMLSAEEPKSGIELVHEHHPDLILLDINLPGMDGYEVLRVLRENKSTHDIPVIAVSANAMSVDVNKGLEAGFDGYITKPIDVTRMLLAVDEMLTSSVH